MPSLGRVYGFAITNHVDNAGALTHQVANSRSTDGCIDGNKFDATRDVEQEQGSCTSYFTQERGVFDPVSWLVYLV